MFPRTISRVFLAGLLSFGCSLARPPGFEVSWQDDGPSAPRVGGVVVREIVDLEPQDIWLIRGKLNDKSTVGLVARNPSDALVERRIPAFVSVQDQELFVLPSVALEPAEIYSVAALGTGVVTAFETRPGELALLSRVGSPIVSRGGRIIYCARAGATLIDRAISASEGDAQELELPLGGSVRARRGVGSSQLFRESCIQLEVPLEDASFLLPPRSAFGFWLDPSPVLLKEPSRSSEPCGAEACLMLRHSKLESTMAPSVGLLECRAERDRVRAFAEGVQLRAALNEADTDYSCAAVFEVDGELVEVTRTLNSGPSEAIFVLNEVLANPNGPEPESEWIEIMNAGNREASLAGYRLADADGETILPDVSLAPGAFGVVVRSDYEPNAAVDVVPAAASRPIIVPAIGVSGLKNAGELLTLSDPSGVILSQIPKLTAKPGQSSARVDPLAPDSPDSFVYGAPTPGAPNGASPSQR